MRPVVASWRTLCGIDLTHATTPCLICCFVQNLHNLFGVSFLCMTLTQLNDAGLWYVFVFLCGLHLVLCSYVKLKKCTSSSTPSSDAGNANAVIFKWSWCTFKAYYYMHTQCERDSFTSVSKWNTLCGRFVSLNMYTIHSVSSFSLTLVTRHAMFPLMYFN